MQRHTRARKIQKTFISDPEKWMNDTQLKSGEREVYDDSLSIQIN